MTEKTNSYPSFGCYLNEGIVLHGRNTSTVCFTTALRTAGHISACFVQYFLFVQERILGPDSRTRYDIS